MEYPAPGSWITYKKKKEDNCNIYFKKKTNQPTPPKNNPNKPETNNDSIKQTQKYIDISGLGYI